MAKAPTDDHAAADVTVQATTPEPALSADEQAFIDDLIRRQREWDEANPGQARLRGFLWRRLCMPRPAEPEGGAP